MKFPAITECDSCLCPIADLIKGRTSFSLSPESGIKIIKKEKKKSKVLCTTLQLLKTSDSGYLMVVITSCHNKQVATLLLYFTLTFG